MRSYLAIPALVALLLLGSPGVSAASSATEVRITAAKHADGRIEFALQQRGADGEWGERQFPPQRFFPVVSKVNVWLVSTPLAVRAAGDGVNVTGVEARITARRVASGRTEFALQQREAGREWGERQFPRQRYFPVTSEATVGRWLVSTPLTVSLPTAMYEPTADTAADHAAREAQERMVLATLYRGTGGAGWDTSTNWLTSMPLGEWYGVTTNDVGEVVKLNLWSNHLTGLIPSALGGLTSLRLLNLEGNVLTGSIPPELGNLLMLESLFLGENQLTGALPPELGNLTALKYLDISSPRWSRRGVTGGVSGAVDGWCRCVPA